LQFKLIFIIYRLLKLIKYTKTPSKQEQTYNTFSILFHLQDIPLIQSLLDSDVRDLSTTFFSLSALFFPSCPCIERIRPELGAPTVTYANTGWEKYRLYQSRKRLILAQLSTRQWQTSTLPLPLISLQGMSCLAVYCSYLSS